VLTDPARTRVVLRIAADPTSAALLLAGPAAVDLWPGVRRVGDAGGQAFVGAPGAEPGSAALRTAGPPRRTPTAYVSRFEWSAPGVPPTTATLTLAYAMSGDGLPATHAALQLDSTEGSRIDEARLRALAKGFLANLGRAAEQRAQAA